MTSNEALNELVGITVLLNGACSNMINCIKGKKCIYNKPCETCYDHNLIMTIKKDLDRLEKLERIFEILQKHMYACRGFMELRITTPKNYKEALKNSWTRYYNGVDVTDKDYDELYDLWLEVLKK